MLKIFPCVCSVPDWGMSGSGPRVPDFCLRAEEEEGREKRRSDHAKKTEVYPSAVIARNCRMTLSSRQIHFHS